MASRLHGDGLGRSELIQPPPSTLAAQFAENFAASAGLPRSRPEEDASELKRLLKVIEEQKTNPSSLTLEDRVKQNHLLIYACCRVVLDSIAWNDPFRDLASEHSESQARRAINFLVLSINESPSVIDFIDNGGDLLYRGKLPLWMWLMPKVLKLLGHKRMLGVSGAIQSLCECIMAHTVQHPSLSRQRTGKSFCRYITASVDAIIRQVHLGGLQKPHSFHLELPPGPTIKEILRYTDKSPPSYTLDDVEQAIRQAFSLLVAMKGVIIPRREVTGDLSQSSPIWTWLPDRIESVAVMQVPWPTAVDGGFAPVLQLALDLAVAGNQLCGRSSVLHEKVNITLMTVCGIVIEQCAQLLGEDEIGTNLRRTTSSALVQLAQEAVDHRPLAARVASHLISPWAEECVFTHAIVADTDLARSYRVLKQAALNPANYLAADDVKPGEFTDIQLREQVGRFAHKLPRPSIEKREALQEGQEPPAKRVREEASAPSTKRARLVASPSCGVPELVDQIRRLHSDRSLVVPADGYDLAELTRHLGFVMSNTAIDGPQLTFSRTNLAHMTEDERCQVINLLTRIPCAGDNRLVALRDGQGIPISFECSVCDGGRAGNLSKRPPGQLPGQWDGFTDTVSDVFTKMLQLDVISESKRARVVAMMALRRILRHSRAQEIWDLEKSIPGQWCLQSLQSSVRELRVAAGRTLSLFLAEPSEAQCEVDTVRRNRAIALGILKSLSDTDDDNVHETCVMAWGQVGRVMGGLASVEEFNLVLIKLVEYLGHGNAVVSSSALGEIQRLAGHRREDAKQLFLPFWDSLAYPVVKDLDAKPQTANMVARLLGMDVRSLLLGIQKHALPWLVLTKKREVIQMIADVRGDKEIWQPCVDAQNLTSILALLLLQGVPDSVGYAMSLLRAVSAQFDLLGPFELFRSDPIPPIMEILIAASGGGKARNRDRALAALTAVARVLSANDQIGPFLKPHALGLTTRLSEVINDTTGTSHPVQEKRRCLGALEMMITQGNEHVSIALPQISACLMAALSRAELRSAAFSCWAHMVTRLRPPDVSGSPSEDSAQMQTTFFLIGEYWKDSDDQTRQIMKELVEFLLTDRKALLQKLGHYLPSLKHIEELAECSRELESFCPPIDDRATCEMLAARLRHENPGVVGEALTRLVEYLTSSPDYVQKSAIGEQPDSVVSTLVRSLLDCSAKYGSSEPRIARHCAQALGLIGCVDPNRLEAVREERQFIVIHNFADRGETRDFVIFTLENVLVKAFLSTTDTKFQGFLCYAMQKLLEFSGFRTACALAMQGNALGQHEEAFNKWMTFSDKSREVLTPFLSSTYGMKPMPEQPTEYPIFRAGKPYVTWLRAFVLDLLGRGHTPYSRAIFEPLRRLIKVQDRPVAEFLLPYAVLHAITGQAAEESAAEYGEKVAAELAAILRPHPDPDHHATSEESRQTELYCEAAFRILDYCMRWLQARKPRPDAVTSRRVEKVLGSLDPFWISQRALDCKQYARALFYLERKEIANPAEGMVEQTRIAQNFYETFAKIDDPDGLQGLSAHEHWHDIMDLDQQAVGHQRAGRLEAAIRWWYTRLNETPNFREAQENLLNCLKETGQHANVLKWVESFKIAPGSTNWVAPFAVEAAWSLGDFDKVQEHLGRCDEGYISDNFNLGIARALLSLRSQGEDPSLQKFWTWMGDLRARVVHSMSYSSTASLRACHDALLQCHVLTDLEIIVKASVMQRDGVLPALGRRREVVGAYVGDKQYLVGVGRAAMLAMQPKYEDKYRASMWISTARLARKVGSLAQCDDAVLHARALGDIAGKFEYAKLLYKEGSHREAIKELEMSIQRITRATAPPAWFRESYRDISEEERNHLAGRGTLKLAKWLDSTGQMHASALREKYQQALRMLEESEKAHQMFALYYKKLLDSEKTLKPDQQSDKYLTGENAKLVIENSIRSLHFGTKYLHQSLPSLLTLWLDLGAQVGHAPEGKLSVSRPLYLRRREMLEEVHKCLRKHIPKLPAYIFFTALAQIVARIAHPNEEVFRILEQMIIMVVDAYPQQALWSLFSFMTRKKTTSAERWERGRRILTSLRDTRAAVVGPECNMAQLLRAAEKLAEELLMACNSGEFPTNRTAYASLTRDLHFNQKWARCPLVVPVETFLTPALPASTDKVTRKHKAFSEHVVTLDSFQDQVMVLSSLAKPRKLTARGSDGRLYDLLLKPKDDLRTDQRLMEFNGMINRFLKRDVESSLRQLSIRTYAVTPLNEECGIIEWVDGLKTLREILLGIYKTRNVQPNYSEIAQLMREASTAEANIHLFTDRVLRMFPPVLPDWFVAQFPEPSAWLAARLRYTRSCAVMSMVGTILGLGDRHGENVLLEEGNGGIFHVDFNCLFDKGLTFAQPERVPFRLTHNMVAAMGIHGYEGPFRRCSELTLRILRQHEETLMTILEAFIHDPTLDLQRAKKRSNEVVRLNPTSVVESIRRKVKGLLPKESIPLGVEGHVEELIKQAVSPHNLAAMYIGWCPFL
ncbi:protein kinase rad3 [Diplogelasinospora grovesii]|uniref:Serine/threonine-protein kinase MEC1 n=1 Tax=Diplogelasinospora grovesii TaxID=303347 RepID=A0AAN6S0V1_9PEZI|nr:protein kinase rad3 [Diplogelasinospora grovesii]